MQTHYLFSTIVIALQIQRACYMIAQSCLTLWDPMDRGLSGSSAHGILLARILEGVAMPSSMGSSQPRNQTQVYWIAGRFFTRWANLILSIYEYVMLGDKKKKNFADGIRFANQLTWGLSWIIWKNWK